MKEHPILFSTEMIKAILEGRKTMTRRIVKPQPDDDGLHNHTKFPMSLQSDLQGWWGTVDETGESKQFNCRYGYEGHLLWVRETWKPRYIKGCLNEFRLQYPKVYPWFYSADGESESGYGGWKPSIHMPKEAARIWLEVINTWVERLQEITEENAIAEGIEKSISGNGRIVWKHYTKDKYGPSPVHSYETLWRKINGEESWNENPFVWVVEFKVLSITGKP